jgi:hypothetical protein
VYEDGTKGSDLVAESISHADEQHHPIFPQFTGQINKASILARKSIQEE